jgi:hypothetical protein
LVLLGGGSAHASTFSAANPERTLLLNAPADPNAFGEQLAHHYLGVALELLVKQGTVWQRSPDGSAPGQKPQIRGPGSDAIRDQQLSRESS